MTFYGFQLNDSKSFAATWFRESCGYHWYRGIDIKPVYLKSRLSSTLSVYRAANNVRRLAHRSCASMACDSSFRRCFDHLVSSIPKVLRLRIPETLGDGGFISNYDEAAPTMKRRDYPLYYEGIKIPNLVTQVAYRYDDAAGYLLNRLWSMPTREPSRLLLVDPITANARDLENHAHELIRRYHAYMTPEPGLPFVGKNIVPTRLLGLVLSHSVIRQWYDLGPWI
jgi:hypothetical protein